MKSRNLQNQLNLVRDCRSLLLPALLIFNSATAAHSTNSPEGEFLLDQCEFAMVHANGLNDQGQPIVYGVQVGFEVQAGGKGLKLDSSKLKFVPDQTVATTHVISNANDGEQTPFVEEISILDSRVVIDQKLEDSSAGQADQSIGTALIKLEFELRELRPKYSIGAKVVQTEEDGRQLVFVNRVPAWVECKLYKYKSSRGGLPGSGLPRRGRLPIPGGGNE